MLPRNNHRAAYLFARTLHQLASDMSRNGARGARIEGATQTSSMNKHGAEKQMAVMTK